MSILGSHFESCDLKSKMMAMKRSRTKNKNYFKKFIICLVLNKMLIKDKIKKIKNIINEFNIFFVQKNSKKFISK